MTRKSFWAGVSVVFAAALSITSGFVLAGDVPDARKILSTAFPTEAEVALALSGAPEGGLRTRYV